MRLKPIGSSRSTLPSKSEIVGSLFGWRFSVNTFGIAVITWKCFEYGSRFKKISGNVASRQKYADELVRMGRAAEALPIYQTCLTGVFAEDPKLLPKVMHTQSAAEYWHRSGSLVHTDPLATRDEALPDNVRVYAFGGTQHGPAAYPPGRGAGDRQSRLHQREAQRENQRELTDLRDH